MHFPYWRRRARLITNNFDEIIGLANTTSLILVKSGRAENATITEAGHVTVIIMPLGKIKYTTELLVNGRNNCVISNNNETTKLRLERTGIFRAWDLGRDVNGLASAEAAQQKSKEIEDYLTKHPTPYSKKYSNATWVPWQSRTWNCASYAEKILRAAGLNVSAGFFISSPLELTTGHSLIYRSIMDKFNRGDNNWYLKEQAPPPEDPAVPG